MQKTLKLFSALSVLLLALTFSIPTGQAQTGLEKINNYKVKLEVNQDSSVMVTEEILYDFGQLERRGIFRNIPYKYQNSLGKFKLRLSDFAVSDNNNQPIPYDKSYSGDDVVLKIGDPDITITGENFYRITYKVERAVNYFSDHEELYWDAIGSGWTVPILSSSAEVLMPAEIKDSVCYTGPANSTASDCTIIKQGNSVLISVNTELPINNGLTVVVSVPAGSMAVITLTDKLKYFIADNWPLALPVVVFVIMFYFWWRFGRDAKDSGIITAQYEPSENLSPLYTGTLVDGKLDNRDLSAEILYLATLGYLTIEKLETTKLLIFKGTDYKLIKVKEADEKLNKQTQALMQALFESKSEVKLSEFKDDTTFATKLAQLKSNVYKELTSEGYYRKNPQTISAAVVVAGLMFGFLVGILTANSFGGAGLISGVFSGIIIVVFGVLMPARTDKGVKVRNHILGLKRYLTVAEKERLDFHNAPDKNPETFEKLLPFAMALGVETQWAKQFQEIYRSQPNWYRDNSGGAFNAILLSSAIGDFSNSVQSAVVSVSKSSSGGSGFSGGGSGGGGGGGGGGSW